MVRRFSTGGERIRAFSSVGLGNGFEAFSEAGQQAGRGVQLQDLPDRLQMQSGGCADAPDASIGFLGFRSFLSSPSVPSFNTPGATCRE
jgi:hypothetical protein